jgi:amidase
MPFPAHHETLKHVTKDNWKDLAAVKRKSVYNAIPENWLLPEGKYSDLQNVMDVPKDCGLLSEQELEITEIDDVAEVGSVLSCAFLCTLD